MSPDLTTAVWRKSSYSQGQAQCVEVACLRHRAAVRDSKNPDGNVLVFGVASWRAFLAMLREHRHDLP
ncbi:DUF397 domain-containing protein [Gandjariella thermophila]|uniref:DUF397 domain-containing protein n=1 Tax=Gandjariella thermophila TaxID=1931992 RepID=A0A4D4JHF4_9PSEU|nr:DUF397 domain-containing protein [Gandjariella thermophila]GDY33719.1 hypothetical protein GTS_53520 [Gandjariella thermophila]